ncbi:16S rRNA (adenine(1518)-N(6)/adenine(1519)-N(6))-dimethyltransferase [Prauserella marina]|uniref:Ribosomal RNA small subunit methyltransferase A n=1 Tax=Prauserella marina TaxID=530584 RepID=A0A222VVU6_9PSEU|nr:16S rRNA (adenine(1518)-N(6)/adenine(1519)-N(6))-dimethyltransferase RsmA [Prauserella marina]ASR38059.1 16S rRNA (adenine(1518)-N(6)/adenine(1519)-N(6))-dimethyltransferase [Prauserella marina]PWV73302.1 16S rRNA (adenine1518-N6/adenine1519-N6)-dimethyltransferase [Prauserella marina]SDD66863.1 16S rRNA (adenine1518-N6/adenine1519-N6)-dimethyltransferase [Prauserella marina]
MNATPGLLGPAEIRGLATELDVRPTKKLGQNFVHDANTVRRIVDLAEVTEADTVLEVGPGLGSLTLGLLATGADVVAVEIDPVLAARLPRTVKAHAPASAERLTVLEADALRMRAADLRAVPPGKLVANLPYNVAVPVVLHLLAELPSLRGGLVMVQTEVADRMAAGPGSRVYGVPSVKLAWYGSAKKVAAVPRAVFWPVPNVDSALVSFTRGSSPEGVERDAVFRVVDAAFSQRRKTLRAALSGWAGSAERAGELLAAAGVDPKARGEQLDVTDFARIAAASAAREE